MPHLGLGGDALVQTARGLIRIDEVVKGDKVLTCEGLRKVRQVLDAPGNAVRLYAGSPFGGAELVLGNNQNILCADDYSDDTKYPFCFWVVGSLLRSVSAKFPFVKNPGVSRKDLLAYYFLRFSIIDKIINYVCHNHLSLVSSWLSHDAILVSQRISNERAVRLFSLDIENSQHFIANGLIIRTY